MVYLENNIYLLYMTKTRSNRSHKNKTMHNMKSIYNIHNTVGECFDATFHGLHEWHKHMFEQLGWMVLAKSYGMTDKIAVYKSSLIRLKHSLEEKIKSTREKDRRDDLHILHKNVMTLLEHAEKDF